MIKIMLDSASDQNESMRQTYDLETIPMPIMVGREEYIDDPNLKVETIHQFMREGKMPKTAQISPQVAEETFKNKPRQAMMLFLSPSSKDFLGRSKLPAMP